MYNNDDRPNDIKQVKKSMHPKDNCLPTFQIFYLPRDQCIRTINNFKLAN